MGIFQVCCLLTLFFGLFGVAIPFTDHSADAITGAMLMVGLAFLFGLAAYKSKKAYEDER
jgi:uncharacterized membrane protein